MVIYFKLKQKKKSENYKLYKKRAKGLTETKKTATTKMVAVLAFSKINYLSNKQ